MNVTAGRTTRHQGSPLYKNSRRSGTQAREGREDPRTEPHAPVHAAPENPTPITLEDMSDQGGVGSVSKAEATLTHPSARDTPLRSAGAKAGHVVRISAEEADSDQTSERSLTGL